MSKLYTLLTFIILSGTALAESDIECYRRCIDDGGDADYCTRRCDSQRSATYYCTYLGKRKQDGSFYEAVGVASTRETSKAEALRKCRIWARSCYFSHCTSHI